jgi:hypothetical protein
MPEVTTYAPGSFCWIDLASTDENASREFYKRLFGWGTVEKAHGAGGSYWAFTRSGSEVAGLFHLSRHERELGRPCGWNTYVACDAIASTAQHAQDLGGRILSGPHPAGDGAGEYARVVDPAGAVFELWRPGSESGAGIYGELNSVCWFELATPDPPSAVTFYASLFGWTTKPGFNDYTEWVHDGRAVGGVVPLDVDNRIEPAHWLPYIRVANADATLTSALLLGGTCVTPVRRIEGVGHAGVVRDPQGARLSFVEFA